VDFRLGFIAKPANTVGLVMAWGCNLSMKSSTVLNFFDEIAQVRTGFFFWGFFMHFAIDLIPMSSLGRVWWILELKFRLAIW
jgi:hypothetical protein